MDETMVAGKDTVLPSGEGHSLSMNDPAETMHLAELPEQIIAAQLGSRERLLWAGRPRQGVFLRPLDAYLIPFSLLWGGFAIYWEYGVLTTERSPLFVIWGIPFVLVGLHLIFGRFFVDARQRSRTYYGLTSERVIIVSGLRTRAVKSLQLRTLTDVSLDERPDGHGTIIFGAADPNSVALGWPGSNRTPAFDSIPQVRDVYDRIWKAQREA